MRVRIWVNVKEKSEDVRENEDENVGGPLSESEV